MGSSINDDSKTEPRKSARDSAMAGSSDFTGSVFPMRSTPFPDSIGGYRIDERIGSGGMSHVYRAFPSDDSEPVALKVLDTRFATDSEMQKRFGREVAAIRSLDHEHIVPLLDSGTDDGIPYLAMKLIHGVTLTAVVQHLRHCESRNSEEPETVAIRDESSLIDERTEGSASLCLAAARNSDSADRDIAELMADAADAAEAAHQQGIVHRDIKPSNLMLDRDGRLWLTDFGLASFDDALTVVTKSGEMIGTPNYMSPEQASADRKSIDFRTDIYSLGAALYELVTLDRPYQGDRVRVLMQISTGRLVAPTHVRPDVPRALESIILKAMQYAPEDRYQSAAAMADDLRRFARGKTIEARRPSLADHAVRWVLRNPTLSIGTVAAACLVALTIIGLQYSHTKEAERINQELEESIAEIHQRRQGLRRHVYASDLASAYRAYVLRDIDSALRQLSRHIPANDVDAAAGDPDLRCFAWRLLYRLCQPPSVIASPSHFAPSDETRTDRAAAYESALVPGTDSFVTVGGDGRVVVRDLQTGDELMAFHPGNRLNAVAVSPDAKLFATGQNVDDGINQVALHNLNDGTVAFHLEGHDTSIDSLAFSADGEYIAATSRYDFVKLHDRRGNFLGKHWSASRNESVAFTPDGKQLLIVERNSAGNQYLQLLSLPKLKPERSIPLSFRPNVFAFSGDGKRLVVASGSDIAVRRWPDGKVLLMEERVRGRCRSVAIDHTGNRIVAGCDSGALYIWDVDEPSLNLGYVGGLPLPIMIPTGNKEVEGITLTPDERAIVTSGNGSVEIWHTFQEQTKLIPPAALVRRVEADLSSAEDFVFRSHDGAIHRLDVHGECFEHISDVAPDSHQYLAVSPDRKTIVASSPEKLVVLSADDGRLLATIETGVKDDPTDGLVFVADGKQIVHLLNDRFQIFQQRDTDQWELLDTVSLDCDGVRGLYTSPDRRWIVVNASATDSLYFYNADYERVDVLPCEFGSFSAIRYSDDGELLAIGYDDGMVEVRASSDLRLIGRFSGHRSTVTDCIFADDNRTLITGSEQQIRFWDLKDQLELGALATDEIVEYLYFCPQRDSLFTTFRDGSTQVWHTLKSPMVASGEQKD